MIIPGILETSIEEVKKKAQLIGSEAEILQIDIADGVLVDGKTFLDPENLGSIKTKARLEIHLMVQNPHKYVVKLQNASRYLSQIEADHIEDFIKKSKQMGYKTGLSISPDTPNHELDQYLPQIDYVQFMGVVPGGQNRPFEPKVLEKIKEFKLLHPGKETQVDGHMDLKNIDMIRPLDVSHFVVGSDIFKDVDPVNKFKELADHVRN